MRRYGFSLLKLAPATGQSDAEAAGPKPRTCLRANQEGFYGAGRLRDRTLPQAKATRRRKSTPSHCETGEPAADQIPSARARAPQHPTH